MARDGASLTRFFKWLEEALDVVKLTRSMSWVSASMSSVLRMISSYGDSFGTICGYLGNGAIVHYSAQKRYGCYGTSRGCTPS